MGHQISINFFQKINREKGFFKDKLKSTASGISGSFVLPISTLAIVAVFLVLGAFIQSCSSYQSLKTLGGIIKSFAYPLLQAIPLLFCVSFAFSFCKGDSLYIWSSIIAYFVFLSIQHACIFTHTNNANNNAISVVEGYTVLFSGAGRGKKSMLNLVDKTLGFNALNTSIFGAFMIGGFIIPTIQKKYSSIHFPDPFSFFSGKRFVPFLASCFSALFGIFCIIFYPWLGTFFGLLGKWIARIPYGIDSFIFGLLEKSLIPFGFHHMFYSPFWYSPIGGDLVRSLNEIVSCDSNGVIKIASDASGCTTVAKTVDVLNNPTTSNEAFLSLFHGARKSYGMWSGDSLIGISALSLPSNLVNLENSQTLPVLDFIHKKLGINVGRFTQGKYPIMQFGLPAAALAMVFSAPKNHRKYAAKTLLPGVASSLFMGITEPLEFMFLYQAPKLFYGFHAVMCGVSFMAMNILGSHIPSVFSGGLIELIILGIIPVAKGTYFWNYLLVGILLAPAYFVAFSFAIRLWDLSTPGRKDAPIVVAQKPKKINVDKKEVGEDQIPDQIKNLAMALGGWSNIETYGNCASRLRYDIVDKTKVNTDKLKAAGVLAYTWAGDKHLQAIVGPKAEFINQSMIKWKGTNF